MEIGIFPKVREGRICSSQCSNPSFPTLERWGGMQSNPTDGCGRPPDSGAPVWCPGGERPLCSHWIPASALYSLVRVTQVTRTRFTAPMMWRIVVERPSACPLVPVAPGHLFSGVVCSSPVRLGCRCASRLPLLRAPPGPSRVTSLAGTIPGGQRFYFYAN